MTFPRDRTDREINDLLATLDHLPAMVAYWDKDLLNRVANAAYIEWFGMSPEEIHGRHIRTLLGPKIYQLNLPYIQGALAGEPQLFNRTLVDTHGRSRYTQASYIPRPDDEGGFFVLVTDITERVRAEEALAESRANTALLRERQRIAADMHDLVVQSLFASGLQLSRLGRDLDPDLSKQLDAVIEQLDAAMTTLRGSIKGLIRMIAPDQMLADLEQLLEASRVGLGFAPSLTMNGPPSLIPLTARPEILAVLQEALSNVTRHACATGVDVTLTTLAPEIRLTIVDNGSGMGELRRTSGLDNMRYRAEHLGGSCTFLENDPHGTIVDWRIPATLPDVPTVQQPGKGELPEITEP